MSETLDKLLTKVENAVSDLPTLPYVVERVLEISSDPDSSMRDLESVVASDPALSARILRAANSGLYAIPQHITSITQVAAILGFRIIRSLCLSIPILSTLGHNWGPIDPKLFRRHSIAVGVAARFISRKKRIYDTETAFTAGLLHDIGKIILSKTLPDRYKASLDMIASGVECRKAESSCMGQSHDMVGASILLRWNLPLELVTAIEQHHTPIANSLSEIIFEADTISKSFGYVNCSFESCSGVSGKYDDLREIIRRAVEDEFSIL